VKLAEIIAIIGCVSTVLAIVGAILAYNKGLKKDGQASGTLLSDIGYIKGGIDDIKRKQEKADDRHTELCERMTAVEASAKQAHLRIDRIENKE